MVSCLKRKNNFTQPCTKRIKFTCSNKNKRKIDAGQDTQNYTQKQKRLKIDDTDIIQEIILLIECGMCSREMLNQCKDRYLNYIQSKEMIEFLNLMKCKKTIEDEMNLYRLVYKIEKILLNNKNLS